MFKKILIANRGEIAVRIIRACQEMGIATVAVYSEADASARHTWLADESVLIGASPPGDSYLCADRIIASAQQLNCDAIHPGYGFLAENAAFAAAVAQAGLTFIGPSAEAIRLMGAKTTARATMQAAGLPVVPGYQASNLDADLLTAAAQLGFPLLVKATAGGGGKGMRLVKTAEALPDALQSARREALNAFGDDTVYLEKLIENAHHIEFQVFGDQFGNALHLFERECSVQRRHQKILEETPSPLLDDELRARMGAAAVNAVQAIGYVNAGTLEFLVDEQRNFYFLEMNTRLQVEHPITELITGIDLVQTQLRVAAGEPLPFRQADLTQRGHAIECRIYAEDPANNFLPAVGKVWHIAEPTGPNVRVDSGITSGDEVTLYYDPLIAKLAVLAADRAAAIRKLDWALSQYIILGEVITNLSFLRDLLAHAAFQAGETPIDFIEKHFTAWQAPDVMPSDLALVVAAVAESLNQPALVASAARADRAPGDPYSPWQNLTGWRATG